MAAEAHHSGGGRNIHELRTNVSNVRLSPHNPNPQPHIPSAPHPWFLWFPWFLFPLSSYACTTPTGTAGDVFFNTTYKVMQYCNGTSWVNTGASIPTASTTGCTTPTAPAGAIFYNSPTGVIQFCNGQHWVDTACAATRNPTGTGCTTPSAPAGTLFYETTRNELQFCDSTHWVAMGWPCSETAPVVTPRKVFVTSLSYTGNVGGTSGANSKCQSLANAAGISGTFKAWVNGEPATWPSNTTVPYHRLDGVKVADNLTSLLEEGKILAPININNLGQVNHTGVWTNTRTQGTLKDARPSWNCALLGSASESWAYIGFSNFSSSSWTDGQSEHCYNKAALYCFEQ